MVDDLGVTSEPPEDFFSKTEAEEDEDNDEDDDDEDEPSKVR